MDIFFTGYYHVNALWYINNDHEIIQHATTKYVHADQGHWLIRLDSLSDHHSDAGYMDAVEAYREGNVHDIPKSKWKFQRSNVVYLVLMWSVILVLLSIECRNNACRIKY